MNYSMKWYFIRSDYMTGSLVTIVKVEFLYDKLIPNPKPFSNPNPNLLRVRKVGKKFKKF